MTSPKKLQRPADNATVVLNFEREEVPLKVR